MRNKYFERVCRSFRSFPTENDIGSLELTYISQSYWFPRILSLKEERNLYRVSAK